MTSRKCAGCKHTKPLDAEHFRVKRGGGWTLYCNICLEWECKRRAKRRKAAGKEPAQSKGYAYKPSKGEMTVITALRRQLGLDRTRRPLYRAGSIADADRLQRRMTV